MIKRQRELLHEEIIIELHSLNFMEVKKLDNVLKNLKFSKDEDFYFIDRLPVAQPWESVNLVSLSVYNNFQDLGDKINKDKEEWNVIKISYLFASLKFEMRFKLFKVIKEISEQLDLKVMHQGVNVNFEDLEKNFKLYRKELLDSAGDEPGSENVAIFIQECC